MKILSINVAPVGNLFSAEEGAMQRIASAIGKQPVAGPVEVRRLGLAGDEQADRRLHGGVAKAVYAYPFEHYAFWVEQRLKANKRHEPMPYGAMGENLTLQGLPETDVWVGDRLLIGEVELEVTEPRTPCFKLNARLRLNHASKLMVQSGYSGFYLRVVREGMIEAGDHISVRPGPRVTAIMHINDQRRKGRQPDLF